MDGMVHLLLSKGLKPWLAVTVFDEWFKKVDALLDQCLIENEGNITSTEVDGIPLNKYASLKLENTDTESVVENAKSAWHFKRFMV